MNKKIGCFILSCLLLAGCSSKDYIMVKYGAMDSVTTNNDEKYIEASVSDTFSKDLAIVTDEMNHMQDPLINAEASLIVNNTKNEVIFSNNAYEKMYPASITKILTALVVLNHGNMTDTVVISKNATSITEVGAKLVGFKEGDQVNLESLLEVFLLYSGNDAGIALAEHIAGTVEEFAKMMNDTAKSLGAVHSNFVNPHGLHDDNHYTTAYDLYLIFNELTEYDEFLSIINKDKVVLSYLNEDNKYINKEFQTTNRYIKGVESAPVGITVVGGKTGTTGKAGNCLILYSKDNDDNAYISVLMKVGSGNSLYAQMTRLLEMIP